MLKIATVNVNGIRAAARNGMADWVRKAKPDIICLQEVRAPVGELEKIASSEGPLGGGWHIAEQEASAKGRAGVAVLSRYPNLASRFDIGPKEFDTAGRWLEVDLATNKGLLTIVSCYVHSGEAETPKQVEKYKFLDAMKKRMSKLIQSTDYVLVVGDLNVGHTELDIKNWKGNLKSAGFLPKERAYFDEFAKQGWVDIGRREYPSKPGPYTWWSFRGKAFDNDAGWRIDYHLATPKLANLGQNYRVDRAKSYDERWTDHSPVVVDYNLEVK